MQKNTKKYLVFKYVLPDDYLIGKVVFYQVLMEIMKCYNLVEFYENKFCEKWFKAQIYSKDMDIVNQYLRKVTYSLEDILSAEEQQLMFHVETIRSYIVTMINREFYEIHALKLRKKQHKFESQNQQIFTHDHSANIIQNNQSSPTNSSNFRSKLYKPINVNQPQISLNNSQITQTQDERNENSQLLKFSQNQVRGMNNMNQQNQQNLSFMENIQQNKRSSNTNLEESNKLSIQRHRKDLDEFKQQVNERLEKIENTLNLHSQKLIRLENILEAIARKLGCDIEELLNQKKQ
ncbi:UNKNOWN [Stylonychia lemnae]|uniref:Uncharacterized protein n=1 Tax=Stylonychia lemnae TaxID=5949 RepID=A0A078A3C8_STYLE|nr:UNKNOWN [Stylonychia lemnae]|eukprot:CDW76783.1 UNKNOWN [Stylonychia lemnae]